MVANEGDQTLSKVEGYKTASHGLAGTLAEVYQSEATHFEEPDQQLLKFHGSYQEDDRDVRSERRKAGLDKAWMFMVRAKIPGGRLTAAQYLAFDRIADDFCDGKMRLTSRQGIQFHYVGKENLKGLIQSVNKSGLTTLGGCGDVNRNVMSCPVADLDWRHTLGITTLADQLADRFTPHTTAYWEIWCDGEKWGEKVEPTIEEPIYGKTYLPRKFKMAVAAPEDNCVDMYTQDLSFEAVHEGGTLLAWDVIIGGGMGHTHGNKQTFPRIGTRIARVTPAEALDVAEEIVKIQRDFGGRADRKHARLKYLLEDRGVEWFREELVKRLGRELPPAGPVPAYGVGDHIGWHEAADGSLFVGIHVPNGRVGDFAERRIRSGLRTIVERFSPQVRVTAKQDIVFCGIPASQREAVQAVIDEFGLTTDKGLAPLRRLAMACVALPTCSLALAEAERYIPTLLDDLEALGVADAPVEIRMTGCPNSCVRTPMAEIGVVGRGPGKYALYLGGSQHGTRLAFLANEKLDETALAPAIQRLIHAWQEQTHRGVAFGDWTLTQGEERLAQLIAPTEPVA